MNPSLWALRSPGDPGVPLSGNAQVDVVVVGAGLTGLLTAYLAAKDGAAVTVVDAGQVASGATGHTTAKVSALHGLWYAELARRHGADAASTYAAANQAGLDLITDTADAENIDCDLVRRAAFTYTDDPDSVESIEAEAAAAATAGIPAVATTDTDLPWAVKAAVKVDDQAQFDPRRFCLGLADQITAAGGTIHPHTQATGLSERPTSGVLHTTGGDITADHVVIATHMPFLDRSLAFLRTTVERSYLIEADITGDLPLGMYFGALRRNRSSEDTGLVKQQPRRTGPQGHPAARSPGSRDLG